MSKAKTETVKIYLVEDPDDLKTPFIFPSEEAVIDYAGDIEAEGRIMIVTFKPTHKVRSAKAELVKL